MNDILLSIKPEYVEKIFNGSKKFEFRRRCCKKTIRKIVIYATSPVKKVVGEIEVKRILKDSPYQLWEKTKNYAGISESLFFDYFCDCTIAYAYEAKKVVKYNKEKDLIEFGIKKAPQSFVYLYKE